MKRWWIALHVSNKLLSLSAECDDLTSNQCESIWCKIYVNQVDNFIAGVCYRRPDTDDNEIQAIYSSFLTVLNQR